MTDTGKTTEDKLEELLWGSKYFVYEDIEYTKEYIELDYIIHSLGLDRTIYIPFYIDDMYIRL